MLEQEKGVFQMCEDFFADPEKHPAPMMITFPSMKDIAWVTIPGNDVKHTAQILILTRNAWFQDQNGCFGAMLGCLADRVQTENTC